MALLSRVAERLYWGARYLERAEDASRVLQSFGDVLADYPGSGMQWSSLVAVAGAGGKDSIDVVASEESAVVQYLLADREHANSIAVSIERSRENLRTCREVMPREAWVAVKASEVQIHPATSSS